MANTRKIKISKTEIKVKLLLMLVVAILLGVSLLFSASIENLLGIGKKEASGKYIDKTVLATYDMRLHYLDVGQADCTFIELPNGETMMIDAGTSSASKNVIKYISELGYKQIDYFVLTHCDEDHVGGAVAVLKAFEIVNIYRPFQIAGKYKVIENGKEKWESKGKAEQFVADRDKNGKTFGEDLATTYNHLRDNSKADTITRATSDTYINTVAAMYAEEYSDDYGNSYPSNVYLNYDGINSASGECWNKLSEYSVEFFAPLKTADNYTVKNLDANARTIGYITESFHATNAVGKNAISPMILLKYKSQKFAFTGDMTTEGEAAMLDSLSGTDRQKLGNVTVYQAGHHGAKESNSQELLNLLNPTFTVVSSNPKGNNYGHPHSEFLDRLANLPRQNTDYLLRTDTVGNIMFGIPADKDDVAYTCGLEVYNEIFEVYWWQVAIGIFVVFTIALWSIRMPKNRATNASSTSTRGRTTSTSRGTHSRRGR